MKINKFLKIALFIGATSVLFTACANKTPKNVKKVEKPRVENINNVLNDAKVFEYDSRQKLYRNKFTQEQNRNDLLLKFGKLCSDKKGKLVYIDHFINRSYVNAYANNKAYICEVDKAPYFIAHVASQNTNSYFSISVDEKIKKENIKDILLGILNDISDGNILKSKTLDEVKNKIYAYTACRSAIKF